MSGAARLGAWSQSGLDGEVARLGFVWVVPRQMKRKREGRSRAAPRRTCKVTKRPHTRGLGDNLLLGAGCETDQNQLTWRDMMAV